jgi:hypothetical protein
MTDHRALRAILPALAVIATLAGVGALFATKALLVMAGTPAALVATPGVLVLFKSYGAVAIPVGYLLYVASRDPVRYAAIIDAVVIGLVLIVLIEIAAVFTLGLTELWAPWVIWGSIIVRTTLAVLLFALRPRGSN